jgi:N,N'-diacetyllegionaminate synthase
MKLIAETAFHHEGDVEFLMELLKAGLDSGADILKIHVLLDLDEYMLPDHDIYALLEGWLISRRNWRRVFAFLRKRRAPFIGLANCTQSVEMLKREGAWGIELHSACLCDLALLEALADFEGKIVLGIGGSTLEEIDFAVNRLEGTSIVLMSGFQNFPTRPENLNFRKSMKLRTLYPQCEFGYADHTAWNHPENLDITLWGAAIGVDYLEKHITTKFGIERTDYSAAISKELYASLARRVKLLDECLGTGVMGLNPTERSYSKYGPMKKAMVALKALRQGEKITPDKVGFRRTRQSTDLSQGEAASLALAGAPVAMKVAAGQILRKEHVVQ